MRIPIFLQPKTLQQRNILYLMLPTLLVLLLLGLVSLLLTRQVMLKQWEQATIARMQTAAHEVDMRLLRPKRLLMLYQEQAGDKVNSQISQFLLERLRSLEGIVEVNLVWTEGEQPSDGGGGGGGDAEPVHHSMDRPDSRGFHRMDSIEVTAPVYDRVSSGTTISLISEFRDTHDHKIGYIEVKVSFFDLVDTMVKSSWWQNNRAFLVDRGGNVLTGTSSRDNGGLGRAAERFGAANELERKTLEALRNNESGTVLGEGVPPAEVSGFYRLHEAPWTMVVIVPGRQALELILTYRSYYFFTSGLGIILALLLIRMATIGEVRAIRRVSNAARQLAEGTFGDPLTEERQDEIGELTRNFNIMTRQLQERLQLQKAMSVAREVQQNLLPQSSYRVPGLDVSGLSVYCEETGGDYFDLLPDQHNRQRVSVVIGDVVGHGVGAALIMASIRALVRCRTSLPGSPVEVITDVNELLCRDTEESGHFVSLFYLIVDREKQLLCWVRCGHDPALIYNPRTAQFSELHGEGLVLGFDSTWQYQENTMAFTDQDLVILLGSDGLWDAESTQGEKFGRERVKWLLADNCRRSAEEITGIITAEVKQFCGNRHQGDDITLVVVKTVDTTTTNPTSS